MWPCHWHVDAKPAEINKLPSHSERSTEYLHDTQSRDVCKRGLIIYRINSLAQLNILPWLHRTSYIWSYVTVRLQNINKTKYYATSCFHATRKNKSYESILCTQDNEQIVQVRRSLILPWNKFPLFLAFSFFSEQSSSLFKVLCCSHTSV